MPARWIYVGFAIATACGGTHQGKTSDVPAPVASAPSPPPPPVPHDRAKKLVTTATACLVGELWIDAEGDATTAAQRSGTAHLCAAVVREVVGQDDPAQIEALRMLDDAITRPLAAKVKELAAADGLDDAHAAALDRLEAAVVAASREVASARRASAKLRAEIENIKSDRRKRVARERIALRLSATEATAASTLRTATALDALLRLPDEGEPLDAHTAGLVLALVRVRAAQDLPRHMKLYTAAPPLAAVFGVATPPLPIRTTDRLKPGAWQAYVTAVAKSCGHPVAGTTAAPEREQTAWNGVIAGFADRLQAERPKVQSPDLAAIVDSAIARTRPAGAN